MVSAAVPAAPGGQSAQAPPAPAAAPRTAARAREAVAASGLAQREVARRMGLDETKLSKSLRGARRFQPDELFRLATATGATVAWLLADSGSAAAPRPGSLPAAHGRGEHASRRLAIVERAWELFAHRGFSGVRMSDVAQAAGVSPAALHYHFESKRELFHETLRYSIKLAYDRQAAELAGIADPAARLRRLFALQAPQGETGRAEWSIWMQTWASAAVGEGARVHAEGYGRWRRTVAAIVAEGCASGSFAPASPAEQDAAVEALTAYADGLGIRVMTGMIDAPDMLARLDAAIERTLRPHAPSPAAARPRPPLATAPGPPRSGHTPPTPTEGTAP